MSKVQPCAWEVSSDPVVTDTQAAFPIKDRSGPHEAAQMLARLADAGNAIPVSLICETELTRFNSFERATLLPILWKYILEHRQSSDRDELIAVGSAIRKYIAIMPMEKMGELSELLCQPITNLCRWSWNLKWRR